ncbi:hypothetical protein TorRG33x02_165510 [Trema orientale]|uniref:Uncharacterized protein n=1 Tax=Trema orientale TaxID=63057 RepID=A0A2P5EQ83_TREOI|nr:hypothetical protein TorRG33x02_165510 [Trema orientale]
MSVAEYICKFNELSRYTLHMVATNELKVDQFMQDLIKTIVRDLKSDGIRGVPFAQIVDRALDTEQEEKDVLDEEKIRRKRQAREMQRGFRLSFQRNRGGQIQKKATGKLYAMAETDVRNETQADPSVITELLRLRPPFSIGALADISIFDREVQFREWQNENSVDSYSQPIFLYILFEDAYSSQCPPPCSVDNAETGFDCDSTSVLLTLAIPVDSFLQDLLFLDAGTL